MQLDTYLEVKASPWPGAGPIAVEKWEDDSEVDRSVMTELLAGPTVKGPSFIHWRASPRARGDQ